MCPVIFCDETTWPFFRGWHHMGVNKLMGMNNSTAGWSTGKKRRVLASPRAAADRCTAGAPSKSQHEVVRKILSANCCDCACELSAGR